MKEHDDSRQKHEWHSNHKAVAKLAKEHGDGNEDKITFEMAAQHMKNKNHESLKQLLHDGDNYQAEHVLEHIHPKHWSSFGQTAINMDTAVKRYERKYGSDEPKQEKKQAVKDDIMRQIKEKRKENEASSAGVSPQADSNRDKWDDLPDDENPKHTMHRISSKKLGEITQGKEDLKDRAKKELANRGVDERGKWIGFDAADKHHGAKEYAKDHDFDGDEIYGHLQTVHHKILGAIAAGHTDPKRLASEELANRGHDHNGNWIGFDKAAKLHGTSSSKPKIKTYPAFNREGKKIRVTVPED